MAVRKISRVGSRARGFNTHRARHGERAVFSFCWAGTGGGGTGVGSNVACGGSSTASTGDRGRDCASYLAKQSAASRPAAKRRARLPAASTASATAFPARPSRSHSASSAFSRPAGFRALCGTHSPISSGAGAGSSLAISSACKRSGGAFSRATGRKRRLAPRVLRARPQAPAPPLPRRTKTRARRARVSPHAHQHIRRARLGLDARIAAHAGLHGL